MKNMALSDLVLVRPRSFPHAEVDRAGRGRRRHAGRRARGRRRVAEAIGDCGFIAGTTSRPRSYHWEFATPRDVAARIVALAEQNRAALLFGSERYGLATEDLQYCNVLVRIPANPEYCSLESGDVGAAARLRDLHGARAAAVARAAGDAARAVRRHGAFLCAPARGARRNRLRGPHRPLDGAAAPAVQPRAARPQRTQHPARHPERGAGPARPVARGGARADERAVPVYLDYAATTPVDPRVAARMARVPHARRVHSATRARAATTTASARARAVEAARAQVAARGGRASRATSSGPRARPRPTTSRSSAWPTTTATRGGTSSPRAPSTRRCSIPAASSSGAAGGSPICRPAPDGVHRSGSRSPRRCGPETVLVSLMHVNNEIGVIQDIAAIARRVRALTARRGCTSMPRRASASARSTSPRSAPT